MKIGLGLSQLTDERLRYVKQLGADGGFVHAQAIPGYNQRGSATADELAGVRRLVESYGLEVLLLRLDYRRHEGILWGLPHRDREIADICATIRAAGQAGVPHRHRQPHALAQPAPVLGADARAPRPRRGRPAQRLRPRALHPRRRARRRGAAHPHPVPRRRGRRGRAGRGQRAPRPRHRGGDVGPHPLLLRADHPRGRRGRRQRRRPPQRPAREGLPRRRAGAQHGRGPQEAGRPRPQPAQRPAAVPGHAARDGQRAPPTPWRPSSTSSQRGKIFNAHFRNPKGTVPRGYYQEDFLDEGGPGHAGRDAPPAPAQTTRARSTPTTPWASSATPGAGSASPGSWAT